MSNSVEGVVDCARKADDWKIYPLHSEMPKVFASRIAKVL